jgi:hypothetical protein
LIGREYEEFFKHPELWDDMAVIDFERMCYYMSSNPYQEWGKKIMRDEDYINTMRRNYIADHATGNGILQWFRNIEPKTFHKVISVTKSLVRLVACGFGVFLYFDIAFGILALAEILGIIEECKE